MKKVFVFCIGGTGIRVMKSVIMLLAAGMKTNNYKVIPYIIDPHLDLEEKKQLNTLIELYEHIQKDSSDDQKRPTLNGFFGTEVESYEELNGRENDSHTSFSEQRPFGEYLGIEKLSSTDINRLLIDTLFTRKSLNNRLSVGFKGNPNVGTVVLSNMMKGSDWIKSLTENSKFQEGDRIFIISSIFGGTGASGYPLLEKTIREMKDSPILSAATMGAVSVQPYFSLKNPETTGSDIDSCSFITKTKAALSYYQDNVRSDYFYYIGDKGMNIEYDNNEDVQDDKAHFVELVAATALFDFLSRPDKEHSEKPTYLSRAIASDQQVLDLSSMGSGYSGLTKNIADFTLFSMLVEVVKKEKYFPLTKDRGIDEQFFAGSSFGRLEEFIRRFRLWYDELSNNKRGFSPLNIVDANQRLGAWVKGYALDAQDDSYYLLEMIKASNKATKDELHNNSLRHLLNYSYQAINTYTNKIEQQ
jgi:hypothetical protein